MNNTLKKVISFKLAIWTAITLSSLVIAFHLFVLFRVIPFENVWAGRLKTVEEMYVYESISILVTGILIFFILVKAQMITLKLSPKITNAVLWIFVVLFILNTLGNLTAKTSLEKFIATPLTFIFALLCFRIVINAKKE